MTSGFLTALTLCTALGCGLVSGVFYAFSTFVMAALARLPAPNGIAAMQSINVAVINPWFLAAFYGTAAGCVVLTVTTLLTRQRDGSAVYLLAGSSLYLAGVVGVTFLFNVPRNDALAAVDPGSASGAGLWAAYVAGWTGWNHVRTLAAVLAATAFVLGSGTIANRSQ